MRRVYDVFLKLRQTCSNSTLEWYKDVIDKHDANISTTRSEAVPSPPPFRSRRRKDKSKGNETAGSEQVVIPAGDARLVLPTYKSSNKKTGVKKGDVRPLLNMFTTRP